MRGDEKRARLVERVPFDCFDRLTVGDRGSQWLGNIVQLIVTKERYPILKDIVHYQLVRMVEALEIIDSSLKKDGSS